MVASGTSDRDAFLAAVRGASKEFATAIQHLSSACRQRLHGIGVALAEGSVGDASDRIEALSNSEEVRAVGASLAGRGIDLGDLQSKMGDAGGPLIKMVIGLTSVALGGLAGSAIAVLFGAAAAPTICLLLIVGGLALALMGVLDLIHACSKKLNFDQP